MAVITTISPIAIDTTGNFVVTSLQATANLQAANLKVTGTANLGSISNLKISGGTANYVIQTDGTGNLNWALMTGGTPFASVVDTFTGNGVQTEFTLSAEPTSVNHTFVAVAGVMQPRSYYSISNANITFSTAPPDTAPVEVTTLGGNISLIGAASTVINSIQSNITQVGTLTSLNVSGNVTANMFIGDGSLLTNISAPPASTAGTVTTNAQPNITSVGTLTSLIVTGNISGANLTGNHYGNGTGLTSIPGANVTGFVPNANVANTAFSVSASNISGTVNLANYATVANSVEAANISGTITASTVSTAAQPNITSIGTLTSLTVSGNATFSSWTTFQQSNEVINTKTGATGVVAHDMSTGATFYHTSPSANFTANFTNVSTTDARAIVAALIIVQGSTPYVPTAVQIDGSAQTIKWMGSTAPTGTASKTDVISFSLIRVSSTWNVYGQYSSYG
jgi:hypothetical protein